MKVMIAGGSGFIGTALARGLLEAGHEVWILTRQGSRRENEIEWDGRTANGWSRRVGDMDAVVNVTGFGLERWPWTNSRKRRFLDSRVIPGSALASAILDSARRPAVLVQISGINYYGLRGETIADESTPAATDYLARLTVAWEAATLPVEQAGVRRVVARSGIVLDARRGQFPLMTLPVRLLLGGPLGEGDQAVPWIHIADQVGALRFLLENDQARGVYNLVAPTPTSNEQFMQALAAVLSRPYWLPTPAFMLRAVLGEMCVLVRKGRYSRPARLLRAGYTFLFPAVEAALRDLLLNKPDRRAP